MKKLKFRSEKCIACFTLLLSISNGEPASKAIDLANRFNRMEQDGVSPVEMSRQATDYWIKNFPALVQIIDIEVPVGSLDSLASKYDHSSGVLQPQKNEIPFLGKEIEAGIALTCVGKRKNDPGGLLQAMQGAFGISLATSYGRSIPDLIAVLSDKSSPSPIDLLVYRIFEENSSIGENLFKLTVEQRTYSSSDLERLAKLSKHPNPVARLIGVKMLNYTSPDDDAQPVAKMVRNLRTETNSTVIRYVVDRASRQRSEVYKEVLPEISKSVEASNPKLKEEALRVMKVIEEAR